jgi:hypothetical protein
VSLKAYPPGRCSPALLVVETVRGDSLARRPPSPPGVADPNPAQRLAEMAQIGEKTARVIGLPSERDKSPI